MYTFLIKPTNNCNLRCKYCFISNTVKSSSDMMSIAMAKLTVDKIAELLANKNEKNCKILWHGGEPLLWKSVNYDNVLSYMYNTYPNIMWDNSLQTNLTLFTDDYIPIFQKYNVKLSTSMDGYEELHDKTRVMLNGNGSHKIIVEKLHKLSLKGIRTGLIVVLNAYNADKLIHIYEYYKRHNQSFRVNPLIETGEASKNKNLAITSEKYANVMKSFFDYWINDSDAIPVYNFIDWSSTLVTRVTSSCSFVENCQKTFAAIEPNGDISACDRLCGEKDFIFGNIKNDNLINIFKIKEKVFEKRVEFLKSTDCNVCKYWDICYGGCPSESIGNLNGINNKFKFCSAYQDILNHIEKTIINNNLNSEL